MTNKWLVKGILGVSIGIALVFASLSIVPATIAFAQGGSNPAPANPPPAGGPAASSSSTSGQSQNPNKEADSEEDTDCAINKMGWILCPLIDTMAKVGDQAFNFLAKTFLETEPELVSNKSGTKDAWEIARNLANVLFIIAFLIVILSQVTGRGLDNYGIKKTLPRLIIAAVAVNASYYICQAMVDISNIMGYEIKNFLVQAAGQISDKAAFPPQTSIDVQTSNGTLGAIAGWLLGAVAVIWFLLPILFVGVGTVIIVCIVIIMILLMRKAFIVLLVVASPIAFVFYLLPNTEKYFQRWLSMFWKLLMVFPVIALLFGGGQLASAIVLVAGSNNSPDNIYNVRAQNEDGSRAEVKCIELPDADRPGGQNLSNGGENRNNSGDRNDARIGACGARSTPLLLGLVAAGIAVAPMIAVWQVLKGAISAAGAIGGKISGAIEGYGNKASGRYQKGREERKKAAQDRRALRAMNNAYGISNIASGGRYRRKAFRDAKRASVEAELGRAKTLGVAEKAQESGYYARQLGGANQLGLGSNKESVERALTKAKHTLEGAEKQEVEAEYAEAEKREIYDKQTGLYTELIEKLNKGIELDSAKTAAQIQRVFKGGSSDMKEAIIDAMATLTRNGVHTQGTLAARTVGESAGSSNPGTWGPADVDNMRLGLNTKFAQDMANDSLEKGRVSAAGYAALGGDDAEWIHKAAAKGSDKARAALDSVVTQIENTPQLAGQVRHNKAAIDKIKSGNWSHRESIGPDRHIL